MAILKIRKNNPVVMFLVVAGLLIFFHGVGLLRPLEDVLLAAVKPLSGRLYSWGVSLSTSYRDNQDKNDLQTKIAELSHQVAILTVANSQCQETADENQKLQAALHFLKTNNFQAVVADIIAQESVVDSNGDLIINRGTRDGLRTGLGVVSAEGVIIGKVTDVKDTSAVVCLTTSPNCQLAAAIQNQSKTQGITDGDLGLTIKMSYIPQLEKIAGGDMVITSGLGGDIPRGLLIGRVTQVYNASNEVWQEATIEPLVNAANLTVVSVIKP
jgi:rod shape-determining protein MreC